MKEIWKDIEGYEGQYQVSNLGRVKSLNYNRTGIEKILQLSLCKNGYYEFKTYKNRWLYMEICKKGGMITRLICLIIRMLLLGRLRELALVLG